MSPTIEVDDIVWGYDSQNFENNDFATFYPPDEDEIVWIFRTSGIPGDSIKIIDGTIYISETNIDTDLDLKNEYEIRTKDPLNQGRIEDLEIFNWGYNVYKAFLTDSERDTLSQNGAVLSIKKILYDKNPQYPQLYEPFLNQNWTMDNLGPFWIPKKGISMVLNQTNFDFYSELIRNYENYTPEVYETYTFKKDYLFFMGDNRHNAVDSRFLGPIPLDRIDKKIKLDLVE